MHPTLIDRSHPLASVREAFNAVFVETQMAGELMFYGPGAGGDPTASAVLGDVVQAARHKVTGGRGPGELSYANLPIEPIGASKTAYFIRLDVEDKPGVLANIAKTIGEQGVSIESMRQGVRRSQDGLATLHLITHRSSEADLADVVERLKASEDVREVGSVLRVEGE